MRKLLFSFIVSAFLLIQLVTPSQVSAQSLYVENYDVNINVNADSTFDVSETIAYRASGNYHRIWREITLDDYDAVEKCQKDSSLQCGGFSYITVTGVFDENGRRLEEGEYSVGETSVSGEDRLKVLWEYAPEGRVFNNELFTWTIEYRVYGGIGFIQEPGFDLFYWDVFYPDRDYVIKKATCDITFPKDISLKKSDIQVYGGVYDYLYDYDEKSYTLGLEAESLGAYEEFTVMVRIPDGIIKEHATLNLDLSPGTQDVTIDGITIDGVKDNFSGIPSGEHDFTFDASGYKPKDFTLSFQPGEVKDLKVDLEIELSTIIMIAAIVIGNVIACLGGIMLIFFVIINYVRKGKDIGGRKTIVPWFKPPDGISPVLVGSVKDERVNLTDITSTIINAAIRGFIKIKETGKKKYTLIKLKDFVEGESKVDRKLNYEVLDASEVKILQDIFDSNNEITTESLNNKFYTKISGINNTVYAEMVTKGYFEKRPDHVRRNHLALGIIMVIGGIALTVGLSFLTIFTCGPGITFAGIIKMILSFFMPAKTAKGTEVFEKAQGFRMFLHTAERFKLQKQLTPELFEKYLPYAMVFGVEKQWAKNFENIYTQPPGWYEGRNAWNTFSTIYLINSLSSMNSNVGRAMASAPSSSGSGWSGGGWSGGGGFSGGFGGGGGGGGGGGMS